MVSNQAVVSLRRWGMRRARIGAMAMLVLGFAALPVAFHAETGWVKGEVRLNLRTGPSNEYRILDEVHTGDRLDVLENGENWTRVRAGDKEGWIPAGYLQSEPPAGVLLESAQTKASELGDKVKSLSSERDKLAADNQSFTERDTTQKSEIESLTRENMELKAGARWPEWITGAAILTAGMMMGWVLSLVAGRRQRPRIRL